MSAWEVTLALGSVSVAGARRTCGLGARDSHPPGPGAPGAEQEMPHPCCLSHPRDSLAAHRGQRVRLCDVGSRAAGLTRAPQRASVPRAGPEPARTFRPWAPRCFSLVFDKITDKTVQNSVQRSQFKPCLPWLSSDWPKQKSLWGSSRQPLPS